MSFTLVEVTGTFERPDGEPASGTVTAQLKHPLENGGKSVEATPVLGELNEAGEVKAQGGQPLMLAATDDTGTLPSGTEYEWSVQLDNQPLVHFFAPVKHTVNPLNLVTIMPGL